MFPDLMVMYRTVHAREVVDQSLVPLSDGGMLESLESVWAVRVGRTQIQPSGCFGVFREGKLVK